jgi:hypothetical protein
MSDIVELRAAFVQGQAQIMNDGTYTPVVIIDKSLALSLLDEIERLRAVMNLLISWFNEHGWPSNALLEAAGRYMEARDECRKEDDDDE